LPPERQAEREGTKPSALARGGDGEEFGAAARVGDAHDRTRDEVEQLQFMSAYVKYGEFMSAYVKY
jgi:hypothetical protein